MQWLASSRLKQPTTIQGAADHAVDEKMSLLKSHDKVV